MTHARATLKKIFILQTFVKQNVIEAMPKYTTFRASSIIH